MARKLRIAVSVFFGVLSLVLVVLWGRSYWYFDQVMLWPAPPRHAFAQSVSGRIYYCKDSIRGANFPRYKSQPIGEVSPRFLEALRRCENRYGFGDISDWSLSAEIVPYWCVVLVCGVMAALSCVHWSLRFSLRTLFVATTLLALLLGMVMWGAV